MKQYLVLGLLIIVAIGLVATPVYGQVSTQRLQLYVYAWANHPVGLFTMTASYKGEVIKKTLDFDTQPKKYNNLIDRTYAIIGPLTFSPKERGLLDFWKVCVTNLSTAEANCEDGYWIPGTDYSTKYIQIFANQ